MVPKSLKIAIQAPKATPVELPLFASAESERLREVLVAAATVFAERGYAATSMREVGERAGLLGGSLYHHIKSKEALFVKIHDAAIDRAHQSMQAAIDGCVDPWDKLEAACVAFCQIQLDPRSLTMPLMNDFFTVPAEVRQRLIVKRDQFEKIFVALVDALPLDPRIDRKIYRLLLLTLCNNISSWYRPGRLTPAQIGQQIMLLFKHEARVAKKKRRT